METPDLTPLVDQLEGNLDELEEILEPLLKHSLSATTQKMTIMDKAKLHVLITYSIESLLFSYLRFKGVNAREHPVFKELTRVKQYFAKIKDIDTVPEKPTTKVDKEAVARFIKHGLAGNDKIDLERAEREAKERAMAQLKAAQLAKRQAAIAAAASAQAQPPALPVPENNSAESEDSSEGSRRNSGAENEIKQTAKEMHSSKLTTPESQDSSIQEQENAEHPQGSAGTNRPQPQPQLSKKEKKRLGKQMKQQLSTEKGKQETKQQRQKRKKQRRQQRQQQQKQ